MPATAWRYIVPYQPDYQAALDDLRRDTFERGAYFQPWADAVRKGESLAPTTIRELLERNGEQGTHSVLDIHGVRLEPAPGCASLAAPDVCIAIYGTLQPEKEDVDQHRFALIHTIEDHQARFLVIYRNQDPHQLYFEGLTGA